MQEFGGQIGEEGGRDAQHAVQQRLGQPAPDRDDEQRDGRADQDAAAVGRHEGECRAGPGEGVLVGDDVDGHGEQDQRGPVVQEALGAQHGQDAARHRLGDRGDGRRVRRGEHRAEDEGDRPAVAQRVGHGGDRDGGGEDQPGGLERDAAEVVADLPHRGGQRLPVQQRGQEEEQDDVRGERERREVRCQPHESAHGEQQQGFTQTRTTREPPHEQDGERDDDDQFQAVHVGHLGRGPVPSRYRTRCSWKSTPSRTSPVAVNPVSST